MTKFYDDNPTTSDTILFDLVTTDVDGNIIDPYKVDVITIYFIERGFTVENLYEYSKTIGNQVYTEYFKEAVPVEILGNDDVPAWLSTDPDNGFITQQSTGTFRLEWIPKFAREGDYVLCYKWTPIAFGDTISTNIAFYVYSDTRQSTTLPSHLTKEDKYETLLKAYQPEMFSTLLSEFDLTPDVLDRLNQAVAKGFTLLEDQANQIVDLIDANVLNEALLPYLANLFGIRLAGIDTTLWRKQIKRAIPLAKKKGTLSALIEALANADIKFVKLTRLWQVVSSSTWQEVFVVDGENTFTLSKMPILPVDSNFEISIKYNGEDEFTELTTDYVDFDDDVVTWVGDDLSIDPVELSDGDTIKILYKIAEPEDQDIEDYIRTLDLADQREDATNWNVRLIEEDDPMFDVIVLERHPFTYPVVFGKVRTEFPYSENIFNMDAYNGSTRDSTLPCDLDKTFIDTCSSCLTSKFTIDVEIEDLSAERIEETEDIIRDFVPFHAIVHNINYSASKNEFVPSPVEEIEFLIKYVQNDNVIATQFNFNRLIEEGSSDALELKRNMLADTVVTDHSGTGVNLAVSLFSPGVQFNHVISNGTNYLEILSGSNAGDYEVIKAGRFMVDIVQGSPDSITFPLDTSGFPYRISTEIFDGSVDIYQLREYVFSDDITFIDYGTADDWNLVITSGIYAGTYAIDTVNPDNTISVIGFPTTSDVTGLAYELRNASSQLRHTGSTGAMTTKSTARVELGINAFGIGIRSGNYVKYSGTQYKVIGSDEDVYIKDYTGGDVIGSATVQIYRRTVEEGNIGYLNFRGMQLNGDVPTISYVAETNQFRENYLIKIDDYYYQISSIDGSDMILHGHMMLDWELTGTAVNYSIVQFTKNVVTTTGTHSYDPPLQFDRLDRRGNESVEIITETGSPMFLRYQILNNDSEISETVSQQEQISFSIEYKE